MVPVRRAGFTLIELIIAIAVMSILLLLAFPNFSIWVQNTQIRTAGEAILSGMQLARAEAIRRNTSVELQMDAASGWTARVVSPAAVIQSRTAQEGTSTAVVTTTPAGSNKVTFNGFGSLIANTDGSATITEIKIDSISIPAADSRQLCVVVRTGGNVRMCDPQTVAPDTRTCGAVPPVGCQ